METRPASASPTAAADGWTPADDAELDVLLWALVDGWSRHRLTCDLDPDPHLREAIAEVLDWREARALLSRAEALRAAAAGGSQALEAEA